MFYIQISDVEKKITDTNLVSTTVFNTKIIQVDNKFSNHINLLPLPNLIK